MTESVVENEETVFSEYNEDDVSSYCAENVKDVLHTMLDGLDDDTAAFLVSAKEEADQLDCCRKEANQHESCQEKADQLESCREKAEQLAPRPKGVMPLGRKTADKAKKRCAYIEHMLRLDAVGGVAPTAFVPQQSCGVSVAEGMDESSMPWDTHVIGFFDSFRRYLQCLSNANPVLHGECVHHVTPPERSWNRAEWEQVILTTDVTVSVLGVCDAVRASGVIEAISSLLKTYNKSLLNSTTTTAPLTAESPRSVFKKSEHSSPTTLHRILQWAFAALASLDTLQAKDENVSHDLQVTRRCCRWLLLQRNYSLPTDIENATRLVELIIEVYFHQR